MGKKAAEKEGVRSSFLDEQGRIRDDYGTLQAYKDINLWGGTKHKVQWAQEKLDRAKRHLAGQPRRLHDMQDSVRRCDAMVAHLPLQNLFIVKSICPTCGDCV